MNLVITEKIVIRIVPLTVWFNHVITKLEDAMVDALMGGKESIVLKVCLIVFLIDIVSEGLGYRL